MHLSVTCYHSLKLSVSQSVSAMYRWRHQLGHRQHWLVPESQLWRGGLVARLLLAGLALCEAGWCIRTSCCGGGWLCGSSLRGLVSPSEPAVGSAIVALHGRVQDMGAGGFLKTSAGLPLRSVRCMCVLGAGLAPGLLET